MSAPRSREELVAAAVAQGLLPAEAVSPAAAPERPWPVLLLTGLGAWLAAVPLIGAVGTLFFGVAGEQVTMYLFGVLLLAGSIAVLRSRSVPLFVEQLAVPMLLAGAGCLGVGLFDDLPNRLAALLLCLLALAIAWGVRTPGLRALLGFAAAAMAGLALLDERWVRYDRMPLWLTVHGLFGAWVGMQLLQRRILERGERARTAAALESVATGWSLCVLAGLAWFAGMSFMVGGAMGGGEVGDALVTIWRDLNSWGWMTRGQHLASLVLALVAAGLVVRAWPSLRQPACGGLAIALAAVATSLPSLGAALVVAAWCAVTGRRWLASSAAATSVWIVGSVYYSLRWTLMEKAAGLFAVGLLLGFLAWLLHRQARELSSTARPTPAEGGRAARLAVAGAALATLVVAGVGIRQNEALIAEGTPVFIELAPVDPRSLMQGDYMRLRFQLPTDAETAETVPWQARPAVVVRRDARGVARAERLHATGTPLQADELRIELTPRGGRWVLVTDAWFFQEGEAALWERARYGEFRVRADGRALLVGMADAELKPLLRP